jgi:tight adherence protein B
LGGLARSIRADIMMRERAKTITTEGKLTAGVVAVIPFYVYFMLNSQYPEKMQLLFDSTLGNIILLFIIFWMSCGIGAIIYTINIKI